MSITEARATQTEESPNAEQEGTTESQSLQSTTPLQPLNPPWMFPTGSRVLDPNTQFQSPQQQYPPPLQQPLMQSAIGRVQGAIGRVQGVFGQVQGVVGQVQSVV